MVFFVEHLPFAACRPSKVMPLGDIEELNGSSESPQLTRWLSFDLAEEMEAGCAHEVIPDSMVFPADEEEPARRLLMAYLQEREEYTLISEESEPLLVARSSSFQSSFELYVPIDGKVSDNQRPAFLLNLSRNVWTLTSQSCDYCERRCPLTAGALLDRTPLARICHFKNAGELADQGCVVDILTPKADCKSPCWHKGGFDKFHLNKASSSTAQTSAAETFQLRLVGDHDQAKDAPLTLKEVGENLFALKYQHPLNMVQALAIALTKFS